MSGTASVAPAEWAGTQRYQVLSRLGHGGMGIVYEAFDRERGQAVAVKRLLRYDPAALYLFKQEFRTLADVRHTNLVHLYELVVGGEDEAFFSMELVRGSEFLQHVRGAAAPRPVKARDSRANVTTRPPPRPSDTIRPGQVTDVVPATVRTRADIDKLRPSLRQLVEGVHALHSAGKLHRDIKPSNVLVTGEGRVVLLDFGVATELRGRLGGALAGSGEVVGTARYMAPEQADDAPLTPASDWYSVGIMLYEALVGQAPFAGTLVDVLTMKSVMDVRPPSEYVQGVPPDLDALCVALLQRDPEARPSGEDLLRKLGARRSSIPVAPVAPNEEAPFIGRESQLTALREAYEASRGGRPVILRVGGASGMGKSTLVHHFLDDLAQNERAIILRGRAYEREAVPYKAVDALVDSLSRHLMAALENGEPIALPADIRLLARLFPVLQSVPAIDELVPVEVVDPQSVRQRAFAALRELLATLATHQPVVLFVDDAQWGDVDSAALLLQVLRPPHAPSLLVLMTYRDELEQTSAFLTEMRERSPQGSDTRDVKVAPLAHEDALRLATALLNATDDIGRRTIRAVARESRGSPFLIEELVRSNRGAPSAAGATLAVLTLDQMIADRLGRLPDTTRRFIELLAVGGRPLPVSALAAAAQVEDSVDDVVTTLSTRRLLRTGFRDAREVVEPRHDRIRETIVGQLGATTLREHHGRLARVLQDAPGADAEAVALHWLGAGDSERAGRFAEGAAEQAASKLAFDQAVRLYRLTLEHAPAGADHPRLRARFGEVLRLAGRSEESARVFLAASVDAPPARRLELHRAASEQLLFSGRIDEGKEILRTVLAAVGMRAPQSPLAAVFWLVVYRLWLAVMGLRFRERAQADVSARDRLRVDALASVALGFSLVDVVLGACMQARHLIEALRVGDRFQVARAMSIEAGHLAAAGGPETPRERALVATAAALAEKDGSPDAAAFSAGSRGIGLFNRGRWLEARPLLDLAVRHLGTGVSGFEMARLFDVYNHQSLGEIPEAFRLMNRLCAFAEERGDRYAVVNMRTSTTVWYHLAAGEPERAQRDLADALAQWTQRGFHVQHWQALAYGSDIELYLREPERAYHRLMAGMPALKKSLLLHSGFIRTMTRFTWGRVAVASAVANPDVKRARLAEARKMMRQLEREHDRWAGVVAKILEGSIADAEDRRDDAIAAQRVALERIETTGTLYYRSPVRLRLAQLLGGDEGRALLETATEDLEGLGIRNPARWSEIFVPGKRLGPG